MFQNQITMKTTTDFNANHVILADLGKLAHYQEPVRCNHTIIILCRKGEISIEINYVTYRFKENGLLVLKPLDIVMLKDGSDDFDCTALMLPVSSLTPIMQDIDITNIKHLAQNPIIYHSEESLLFVKQSFSLLVYAKNIVGYAGFEKLPRSRLPLYSICMITITTGATNMGTKVLRNLILVRRNCSESLSRV